MRVVGENYVPVGPYLRGGFDLGNIGLADHFFVRSILIVKNIASIVFVRCLSHTIPLVSMELRRT